MITDGSHPLPKTLGSSVCKKVIARITLKDGRNKNNFYLFTCQQKVGKCKGCSRERDRTKYFESWRRVFCLTSRRQGCRKVVLYGLILGEFLQNGRWLRPLSHLSLARSTYQGATTVTKASLQNIFIGCFCGGSDEAAGNRGRCAPRRKK